MTKQRKGILVGCAAALFAVGVVLLLVWQWAQGWPLLSRFGAKNGYDCEEKNAVAMGTVVSMKLFHDGDPNQSAAVLRIINTLEDTISWRKDGSAVAQLNETGACEDSVVAEIITACAPISEATDGMFDLSVGAVSRLWDFGGENEGVPDPAALKDALATVDYTALRVDGSIAACNPGQQLDFGAVGKGLACDLAKQYLQNAGVKGAVLSVGGSICVFGARSENGDPWRIGIRDPFDTSRQFGVITLNEGFVSTSGDYEKFFEQDGVRYFHILDAHTGYPATSGLKSVTVVCDSGLLSDALSTACFLLGKEASAPLLEKYRAAAVFVDADGTVSTFGTLEFEPYES